MSSHRTQAFESLYDAVIALLQRQQKHQRDGISVSQIVTEDTEIDPVDVYFDTGVGGINDLTVKGSYVEFAAHKMLVTTDDYLANEKTGIPDITLQNRCFPDKDTVTLTVAGVMSNQ